MSLSFLAGKYATFVWPAYGISLIGVTAAVVIVWCLYRRAAARLTQVERDTGQEQSQD